MTVSLAKTIRSGLFIALLDQVVASTGAFGFNLTLAKGLAAADYGMVALILSVILYLNALHQALVIYPLSLKAADAGGREFARLGATALLLTFLLQGFFLLP